MLVIEVANNSAKHVFRRNLGSLFEVSLIALPGHRAMLRIKDDGPGTTDSGEIATLMAFLESTIWAAADLGGWDRKALEPPMGEPRRPRPLNSESIEGLREKAT
jgi:hypothetical protein